MAGRRLGHPVLPPQGLHARSAPPSSGAFAKAKAEFDKRNAKLIGLSVDSVESHKGWGAGHRGDPGTGGGNFPVIADADRKVADLYGMIHPNADDTLTVRSVFIVGPDKKVKLTMTYPACTGRNVDEIIRVIDSLQLTAEYQVATPVNWNDGEDVIIVPAVSRRGRQGASSPRAGTPSSPTCGSPPSPTAEGDAPVRGGPSVTPTGPRAEVSSLFGPPPGGRRCQGIRRSRRGSRGSRTPRGPALPARRAGTA